MWLATVYICNCKDPLTSIIDELFFFFNQTICFLCSSKVLHTPTTHHSNNTTHFYKNKTNTRSPPFIFFLPCMVPITAFTKTIFPMAIFFIIKILSTRGLITKNNRIERTNKQEAEAHVLGIGYVCVCVCACIVIDVLLIFFFYHVTKITTNRL